LATRVYELGKEPSPTLVRKAQGALTDANPYLKASDQVPAGTVIAVPEIGGVALGTDTQSTDETAANISVAQLAGAAGLIQATVAAELDAQAAEARATAAFLSSAQAKQLAGSDDRFKQALPEMRKTAAAQASDAKAMKNYSDEAYSQLTADLESLACTFG
jgi:hypothetical protein